MRHLLSNTVNPKLPLQVCLQRWSEISAALREPPRLRRLQMTSLQTIVIFSFSLIRTLGGTGSDRCGFGLPMTLHLNTSKSKDRGGENRAQTHLCEAAVALKEHADKEAKINRKDPENFVSS